MYAAAPGFLLEKTDIARRWLRRYAERDEPGGWTCAEGWHEAMVEVERGSDGDVDQFAGDARWPETCSSCSYEFVDSDRHQLFTQLVYRVTATVPGAALAVGDETTLRDAPGGAMWFADWAPDWQLGFDGRSVEVRLQNGRTWRVDDEASNCTRKGDRSHRCWIRHGEPPFVHVDKQGETCAAGAGSIQAGDYHGFLHAGVLTAG